MHKLFSYKNFLHILFVGCLLANTTGISSKSSKRIEHDAPNTSQGQCDITSTPKEVSQEDIVVKDPTKVSYEAQTPQLA